MSDSLPVQLLVLLVSALAAFSDLRTGHIPNWLTLPVVLLAPVVHALTGGASGLLGSLIGMCACAAAPALVFALAREGMGGGDVKLFAALGALGGAQLGIEIEFLSFVAAAGYALALAAYRGRLGTTLGNSLRMFVNLFLPAAQRRPLSVELLTPLRLGGAVLAASLYTLALHRLGGWT